MRGYVAWHLCDRRCGDCWLREQIHAPRKEGTVKKSRQVVLLITGSVLLTACNQEQNQGAGYSADFGTNQPGASNSSTYVGPGGTRVVHHSPIIYPWYHPSRYFGPGSSPSRSSGLSSPSRSGSGNSGASHTSSSPSRGGFGSHSTSSS
jgi:hypothetical protein